MDFGKRDLSSIALALCLLVWAPPASATALDDYVTAPDSNYAYTLSNTISGPGFTAYVLDMTSQQWRTSADIEDGDQGGTIWRHWLTVFVPDDIAAATAFLYINGGNNGRSAPTSWRDGAELEMLAGFASATNTVVANLGQIPNQRLKFTAEPHPESFPNGRTEDELIAYAWDKFLTTADATWLPRLPMTKAVVRAMDTIQSYVPTVTSPSAAIDAFVVAGASKRGWTTWTTAAVDSRVVAIVPLVIDLLNVEVSFNHHWSALGFWAAAVHDYEDMGIMERMGAPQLHALWEIVDPYWYRDRYTMPKYIVNSAGDDFFLPDSSQFYFDDLPADKYLRYVPNTDHGLNTDAMNSVLVYYQAVLAGDSMPQFSWTLEGDDSIRVLTDPLAPPGWVNLWQAANPSARDFRKNPYPSQGHLAPTPVWTSSPLSDQGGGVYIARVPEPPTGWTAFFVELIYDSPGPNPYKFTTEVTVVPYHLPFSCDFDQDADIDLIDLDTFANQWLATAPSPADVAPKGGDRMVNFYDFTACAQNWSK
ncbi:MAG: PhoPQ-activated pathogenicity-related family protein [Sedimentisphaerales bacterium]|nr:PhoPQ-activated pathogenicity-related family protein [Sedimentisphaerales bacterium]